VSRASGKGEGLILALLALALLLLLARWLVLGGLLDVPTKNEVGGSLCGAGRRHYKGARHPSTLQACLSSTLLNCRACFLSLPPHKGTRCPFRYQLLTRI